MEGLAVCGGFLFLLIIGSFLISTAIVLIGIIRNKQRTQLDRPLMIGSIFTLTIVFTLLGVAALIAYSIWAT